MRTTEGPDARGLAALILGASLLGFAAMLVRWATPAGPLAVGFYRMAIALPFVAWLARGTGRPLTGRARFWALIAATFLGFLGFGTVLPALAPHVRYDLGGSDRTVGFVKIGRAHV